MNFLSSEQRAWHETVDRFMEKEITREYIREHDMERAYPYEAYEKIAQEGWLRLLIPEDHGGFGGDIFDYALMCEGLGKFGFDFATSVLVPTFTAMNIVKFGSDAQKETYLEAFMSGTIRFSISISEPQAGSDAASTRTRARRDGMLDEPAALDRLQRHVLLGDELLFDVAPPGGEEVTPGDQRVSCKPRFRQGDLTPPAVVLHQRHRRELRKVLAVGDGSGDDVVAVGKDVGLDHERPPRLRQQCGRLLQFGLCVPAGRRRRAPRLLDEPGRCASIRQFADPDTLAPDHSERARHPAGDSVGQPDQGKDDTGAI